jgi:hypothetical protein
MQMKLSGYARRTAIVLQFILDRLVGACEGLDVITRDKRLRKAGELHGLRC